MDEAALIVGSTSLLAVPIYLYLGRELARRPVSPEARIPALQFAVFWLGLSATSLLTGVLSLYAAWSTPSVEVVLTFFFYTLLLACAALWGLVGYLFFLYTGRSVIVPVSVLYIVEYGLLVYYVVSGHANGVTVSSGSVNLHFAVSVTGAAVAIPIFLLVVPELLATVAYLSLYFRARDATVRYRILCVGLGILGWFGLDLISAALLGQSLLGLLIGKLLVLLAAGVVWLAYHPPRFVRVRFGVAAI